MNPNEAKQYLDMIGQSFDALATRLGIAATKVMPYLIRQAWVSALSNALFSGITLIIGIYFIRIGLRIGNKEDWQEPSGPVCAGLIGIGGAASLIGGIIFICGLQDIIQVAINPEWAGLLQIKNLFPQAS